MSYNLHPRKPARLAGAPSFGRNIDVARMERSDIQELTGHAVPEFCSAPTRVAPSGLQIVQARRTHRAALLASCAFMALALLMPVAAQAVECSNGGAGPNPAGNDGGVGGDNNTACGNGADASGAGSGNTATGFQANASGNNSINTATGAIANASGTGSQNIATGARANASGGPGSSNIATGVSANASGGPSSSN